MFLLLSSAALGCPFLGTDSVGHHPHSGNRVAPAGYEEAFAQLNLDDVKADIASLLTDSKDFWPADNGNYGPLMIRLAWHSAGSYRLSDGRGGGDGGRIRFNPEQSWGDNTNLDKARRLLSPIKEKYGLGLSWGDLIILAGNVAIEDMGGPEMGFCGGRVDDVDGFWSVRLGPSADQEENEPCDTPGDCQTQGANDVGLIYVNPQGPQGNPDPVLSAVEVRDVFGRMGMNDIETVALIAGGHEFGRAHGACDSGAGPSPEEDPLNPWPGMCGSGDGVETFTSGFEGAWSLAPNVWGPTKSKYLDNMMQFEWEQVKSPAGNVQWKPTETSNAPLAPLANGTFSQPLMMLTADLALKEDSDYNVIVKSFMRDFEHFENSFAEAWYKLTTRDMGPVARCLNSDAPSARGFQNPLPETPSDYRTDFEDVKGELRSLANEHGDHFVRLAWRCAATYRATDYAGGCNGARIRMSPQKDWPVNAGLDEVLDILEEVKENASEDVSMADLIVLAGTVALEEAGGPSVPFCGGRVDADTTLEDPVSGSLEYWNNKEINSVDDMEQARLVLGLSVEEYTALMGARSIFTFPAGRTPSESVGSEYFKNLISLSWHESSGLTDYVAKDEAGNKFLMNSEDVLLVSDPSFRMAVERMAFDEAHFKDVLAYAWAKLMNADRFDGPTGNVCSMEMPESDSVPTGTSPTGTLSADNKMWVMAIVLTAVASPILFWAAFFVIAKIKGEPKKRADDDMRTPLSPRDGVEIAQLATIDP